MSHPKYKDIGDPADRLMEECAELIQAICKAKRFGWENWHPDRPKENNLHDVLREIGDVLEAIEKFEAVFKLEPKSEATNGGKVHG